MFKLCFALAALLAVAAAKPNWPYSYSGVGAPVYSTNVATGYSAYPASAVYPGTVAAAPVETQVAHTIAHSPVTHAQVTQGPVAVAAPIQSQVVSKPFAYSAVPAYSRYPSVQAYSPYSAVPAYSSVPAYSGYPAVSAYSAYPGAYPAAYPASYPAAYPAAYPYNSYGSPFVWKKK